MPQPYKVLLADTTTSSTLSLITARHREMGEISFADFVPGVIIRQKLHVALDSSESQNVLITASWQLRQEFASFILPTLVGTNKSGIVEFVSECVDIDGDERQIVTGVYADLQGDRLFYSSDVINFSDDGDPVLKISFDNNDVGTDPSIRFKYGLTEMLNKLNYLG